uniref:Radial spoke head 1 homolog n=2 Tax=Iconisemion striatum TaxID=60296 RepID=A0A1A7XT03_9TELE
MSDVESDEGRPTGRYEGDRNEREERHGFGKAFFPNGDIYEGHYQNGIRHGQGTYRFHNGARYIGNYYQNLKHGQGIFYYPDGSKYEGSWLEDLKHGHGVYTYPNGDTYDGDWQRNLRHGQGIYHYKDTGVKYTGTWESGNMESTGEYIFSNYRYNGNFLNNKPQGVGSYVFDHGYEQHGEYQLKEQQIFEHESNELITMPVLKWIPKHVPSTTLDPEKDSE